MPFDESKPVALRSAKFLWLLSAVIFFCNGGVYGTWATQVPIIKSRLVLTDAHFGLLLMAMGIGALAAMIVSGWLLPRVGATRLITYGMAGFIVSLIALSLTSSIIVFAIALLSFGATGGLMDVAMNAQAAESEKRIGRPVMSSIHGMWNVGGLVGSGLGGLLLSFVSGPMQATLISVTLAALFLVVRPHIAQTGTGQADDRGRPFWHSQSVWILGALAFLCFSAEGSIRDWSSLYLNLELQLPLATAGWGYSVCSALMAVGRLAGDQGRKYWGDKCMVVGSGAIAALGFGLATTSMTPIVLFGFALIGLGLSNIVPTIISSAGRLPNSAGSITTVVAMGYGGYLASPPLLGSIVAATSLGGMFQVVGIVCVLIAAAWLVISTRVDRRPNRD